MEELKGKCKLHLYIHGQATLWESQGSFVDVGAPVQLLCPAPSIRLARYATLALVKLYRTRFSEWLYGNCNCSVVSHNYFEISCLK